MSPVTFSTALSMTFDGLTREADYIVWYEEESMDRIRPPDLIIGEAKSLGEGDLIHRNDIARLKDLGTKFPGAILALSVLRDDFTDSEKTLLRRLVKWGRRLNAARGPTNRILLLTTNEMFQKYGILSSTWEELGGRHAAFADYHHTRNLRTIADATVAIYLGLPSFEEERHDAWERRRNRGKAHAIGRPPGRWGRMLISVKPTR